MFKRQICIFISIILLLNAALVQASEDSDINLTETVHGSEEWSGDIEELYPPDRERRDIFYSIGLESTHYVPEMGKLLEGLDIVRNIDEKYTADSNISRRDAFQMVYIVRLYNRVLGYNNIYTPKRITELRETMQRRYYNMEFTDVEIDSYDHSLLYSLIALYLIVGEADICRDDMSLDDFEELRKTSETRAAFDRSLTYNEALTIIGRIFRYYIYWPQDGIIPSDKENIQEGHIYSSVDETAPHPYYEKMQEACLINCGESSPVITEDMLDKPIPAYEFLHLLYRSLFIGARPMTDSGTLVTYEGCYYFALADCWADNRINRKIYLNDGDLFVIEN